MTTTKTGRHSFQANKKGVAKRIGYLVDFLKENPHSSAQMMAEYLQTIHGSYNIHDVSQPMRQMRNHGIVKMAGKGASATYSLTSNGVRIWNAATLVWIPKA